jgi:hypothetical protein
MNSLIGLRNVRAAVPLVHRMNVLAASTGSVATLAQNRE